LFQVRDSKQNNCFLFTPTSRPDAIHTVLQVLATHSFGKFIFMRDTLMSETCREEKRNK